MRAGERVFRLADGTRRVFRLGRARLDANAEPVGVETNRYYAVHVGQTADLVIGSHSPSIYATPRIAAGAGEPEEIATAPWSESTPTPNWRYVVARNVPPDTYYVLVPAQSFATNRVISVGVEPVGATSPATEGKFVIVSYEAGRTQPLGTPFELRKVRCPYRPEGTAVLCSEMAFPSVPRVLRSVRLRSSKVVLENGRSPFLSADWLGDVNRTEVVVRLSLDGIEVKDDRYGDQYYRYRVERTGDL